MTKYREILRLSSMGIRQQNIAASCNVSKKTVMNRVLKKAKELNLSWPLKDSFTEDVVAEKLFPHHPRPFVSEKRMPDFAYIRQELPKDGVNRKRLWTECLEDCRAAGEDPLMYSQFCYYVQQDAQKHRATMHIARMNIPVRRSRQSGGE